MLMQLVRLVLGGQVVSTGAAWLTVSTRSSGAPLSSREGCGICRVQERAKGVAAPFAARARLSVSALALSMSPAPLWTSGPPKSGQADWTARRVDWKSCQPERARVLLG